jgi:hypothetical protein
MRRSILLMAFWLSGALCLADDAATFTHIKIHRHKSPQDRVLVDKTGTLTFNDADRNLAFENIKGDNFDVSYDDVTKLVFEVTTHMRGGALAEILSAGGVAGLVASAAIASQHVRDHWFYLEYKNGDHNERVLLTIPKDSSDAVIGKATAVFGSRATLTAFNEKGEETNPNKLPDFKSKHKLKVDKRNHPLPELKPDKALVVVVCPPLAARDAGHGSQYKLHANDRVVVVNRPGTYSFAYLDPGKYRLVSQLDNANGFAIELEAGKPYYFLQNTFEGYDGGATTLSRNSPELVMYELDGSYFADWKRK